MLKWWELGLKNCPNLSRLRLGPKQVGSYETQTRIMGLGQVAWDSATYFYFCFIIFICSELGLWPSWPS